MNETKHYEASERWLARAEKLYEREGPGQEVETLLAFANVHAQLSIAADEDRIAACVPDGVDALAVSVRGR